MPGRALACASTRQTYGPTHCAQMALIEQLGDLVGSGAPDLSEAHRCKVVACVKDWIASYVVGLTAPEFETVAAALAANGSVRWDDTSSVLRRESSSEMALRMAIVGHLANFNDAEFVGNTSPTSVLLPAILPLAASRNATMASLVDAMAVGYGAVHLLGRVMNPDHFDGGWNATSTIGCIAAAAAVARCLRLSARQARAAVSIAAGQMSGLKCGNGSIAKPLNAGRAASAAVWSALLAAHNAPMGPDVWSGSTGALRMFGSTRDSVPPSMDVERGIEAVAFKEFPCFFGSQEPVALARELSRGIDGGEIAQVMIVTSAYTHRGNARRAPSNWAEGQFSCAHCVAVALVDGERTAITLNAASLHRPEIRRVERLTVIEPDVAFTKFEAKVRVSLRDGRQFDARGVLDLGAQGSPALADSKLAIVLSEHVAERQRSDISTLVNACDANTFDLCAMLQALIPAIRPSH